MLFTTVSPMEDENGLGGDSMRLDEAKDRSIPEIGNAFKNTVLWCNLKLAQESALQFYQTRSHAIVLYNTLPAVCIETAVCLKLRMCSSRRCASLRECHGLYPKRTRSAVNKIYEAKTQDHLGTHQATRRVTDELGTTPLTTNFLAYHFRHLNSRIQHVIKGQEADREVSRSTSTWNPSFRT